MIKCFFCIIDAYHKKIKWSEINDTIFIFQGISYCSKHLELHLRWKEKQNE
jgi:hypothetical protein